MSDEKVESIPPRGFEVAAQARAAENIQRAILEDVNLRKWCVEKSIECGVSGGVMAAARAIYAFISNNDVSTIE